MQRVMGQRRRLGFQKSAYANVKVSAGCPDLPLHLFEASPSSMTQPKAQTKPIRFIKGGVLHTLQNVPPQRTLLEVLREDLHQTGTKEGCGEGDCGACTVVVGKLLGGKLQTRAVNSCIKMAHSVDGMALWTVEDLVAPDGRLHPAQESLVQCHGSQCGFCTPGFVMSMAALCEQAGKTPITRESVQQALSGNLCRCTGYRPILDAACQMQALPRMPLDTPALQRKTVGKMGLKGVPGLNLE